MEENKEEMPADPLDRAEKHIENGDFYSAQYILNGIDDKNGRKHYLQSKIYKSAHWYNEQRKQLIKAVKAEPNNEVYKKELEELMEFSKTAEYEDTLQHPKGMRRARAKHFCDSICDAMRVGC